VGSFTLVDASISNTPTGIAATLIKPNSTALLLQNVGFLNMQKVVLDTNLNYVSIPGGAAKTTIDSWGFGVRALRRLPI
jgi:hypothetical protein